MPNAVQRSLKKEFLQYQPNPKAFGEHPLGNQFGNWWRGDDTGNRLTRAGWCITAPAMDVPNDFDFPLNQFTVFGKGQRFEWQTALEAAFIGIIDIVKYFFKWQIFS